MSNEEFLAKLKAIDDNTRLIIIQMLSKNGTMCACRILEELNITQGTLSHHMKVLLGANLVSCKKDGKWCHYTLVNENLCDISRFVNDLCNNEVVVNSCCKYN